MIVLLTVWTITNAGESADWPTRALASSDEGSDAARVGLSLSEAARSPCRGGGGGDLNRDHEGRFLKGDLFPPRKAATRHGEEDSGVVWVGSWDEAGRGWRTGVDKLGTVCRE
jgi:hypothetical protein